MAVVNASIYPLLCLLLSLLHILYSQLSPLLQLSPLIQLLPHLLQLHSSFSCWRFSTMKRMKPASGENIKNCFSALSYVQTLCLWANHSALDTRQCEHQLGALGSPCWPSSPTSYDSSSDRHEWDYISVQAAQASWTSSGRRYWQCCWVRWSIDITVKRAAIQGNDR